jgi:hypothetical protein
MTIGPRKRSQKHEPGLAVDLSGDIYVTELGTPGVDVTDVGRSQCRALLLRRVAAA